MLLGEALSKELPPKINTRLVKRQGSQGRLGRRLTNEVLYFWMIVCGHENMLGVDGDERCEGMGWWGWAEEGNLRSSKEPRFSFVVGSILWSSPKYCDKCLPQQESRRQSLSTSLWMMVGNECVTYFYFWLHKHLNLHVTDEEMFWFNVPSTNVSRQKPYLICFNFPRLYTHFNKIVQSEIELFDRLIWPCLIRDIQSYSVSDVFASVRLQTDLGSERRSVM